jgi:Zn ribbon nucleic-acid-binding protein
MSNQSLNIIGVFISIYYYNGWSKNEEFIKIIKTTSPSEFADQSNHMLGKEFRESFGLLEKEGDIYEYLISKGAEDDPMKLSLQMLIEFHQYAVGQLVGKSKCNIEACDHHINGGCTNENRLLQLDEDGRTFNCHSATGLEEELEPDEITVETPVEVEGEVKEREVVETVKSAYIRVENMEELQALNPKEHFFVHAVCPVCTEQWTSTIPNAETIFKKGCVACGLEQGDEGDFGVGVIKTENDEEE